MSENQLHSLNADQDPIEQEALHKLAAGDREAFTFLYNRYQPLITKLLYPFQPTIDAKEMVQDIFYKIWVKRELMIGINSFKGYLIRMVRNKLIDRDKSRRVQQNYKADIVNQNKENIQSSIETILFNELHQGMLRAIDNLPDRQRSVLQLSLLQGLSRDEIASALDISVWVVDKDLSQATKTVRAYVQRY